jgi:hypothetical protein
MNTKELTIETLEIEIKVIRVGGHKMTKAVFDQIEQNRCNEFFTFQKCYEDEFTDEDEPSPYFISVYGKVDPDNLHILGYVNTSLSMYILFTYDGRLYKHAVHPNHIDYQQFGARTAFSPEWKEFYRWLQDSFSQLYIAT